MFTVSLLLLSVYLPLAGMIYTESWYRLHCDWYDRCLVLGELAERSIANLTNFFLHREALHGRWSHKESLHLAEVRGIYDVLAGIAVLAALGLAYGYRGARLRRASLINIAVIVSLLLLLPAFGYFWRHVFHELMFSNELWRTDRNDITWYITPRVMFRNAIVALVIGGAAVNLAVLAVDTRLRKRKSTRPKITKR
ncbi:MAG: DUF1461 domain-containing protein [Gammaproteobacteria bacterium]|nr:DUF1461 domain-containing protein [Gammaproteobacteria bacterium]